MSSFDDARSATARAGAMPEVVCWGEVLWDMFPDGRLLGGAPANVAYHLAVLGAPVALATRVGDDEPGREAVAAMRAAGVDTSLVQVDPERPTGQVGVKVVDGEPSYQLKPGCAWERIAVTGPVERALAQARAFCFGTLSQRRSSAELERALALLPAGCVKVCDPNLRPGHIDLELTLAAVAAADVVKINDLEADILARHVGVDDAVAWMLSEHGVDLVALTRGARGSSLIGRSARSDHPGFAAAPGGDNVGAGDAFTAALVYFSVLGSGLGRDLAAINRAANRYAAHVASCRGATPAVPAELLRELG